MKQTTNDWLTAAEDDLLAAKKLAGEDRLLPHGKPTISEIETFILFCDKIFTRLKEQ